MTKDTILIVEDECFYCSLLENILHDEYNLVFARKGLESLETLRKYHIDLILLDIMLPDIDGYEVCKKIKAIDRFSKIPIIFLTVKNEPEDELKGFKQGAVDYIIKPISPPVVKARVASYIALSKANEKIQQHALKLEQLVSQRTAKLSQEIAEKQKAYDELHYLANYDPLTQLPNRNLFNERLSYTYKLAKRNKTSFSLLLIDLDSFKQVNDSFGHLIGDQLLKQVGARLLECVRDADTVARIGGDEFTVTLTEIQKKADASIVAEKIITELSQPFEIKKLTIHIGASIGITTYPDDGEDLDSMFTNADVAMYEAKDKGKNTYIFFSPAMTAHTY